jgi:uncharacterized protein VirK/YbjX
MSLIVPPKAPSSSLGSFVCAWQITSQIHSQRAWYASLIKCVGRAFTAMATHGAFSAWVDFLLKPENRRFSDTNPMLWHRTLLGYMSTRWDGRKTVQVLTGSYRFALNHPGPMLAALQARTEQPIASVELEEDRGRILVSIHSDDRFRREGEWTVRVRWDQAEGELCSIAFSVEEVDGRWIAYIGALQGGSGANEESIKAAAKAFHGVRPKAMAVFALQEIISTLGVSRLLGAGNSIQMSNAKHLIPVPWNKISFNYDAMWAEAGAKPAEEGWFELPLRETRRTREEIKVNKRPLYARRYAFFDRLQEAVAKSPLNR